MKLVGSTCEIAFILIVADFLYVTQISNGANDFRRCYNTTKMEMHCFDVQYDSSNDRLLITSFDDALQICKDLNSTLIIIKDEDTNQFIGQFMTDYSNPIREQYIWTDAYRINDYGKTYNWQWLNSILPNLSASDVDYSDYTWYVAALGFNYKKFTLMAQQPHLSNKYICEYAASNCSSVSSSNVRMLNGRCYIAMNGQVNWYEARNRCLKGGGDLASFVNVTIIDFKSWLGSDANVRYWIGLRFARYIWKESGEDVKFSKWTLNYYDWTSPCLIFCSNCNPNFSWLPKDCNIWDSIYVVCHTVTSLLPTTTITATSSTVPTITTTLTPAEASTALKISQNADNPSSNQSKIQVGIGVGVGVGVPVIIAIALLAIFLIRRHRQKTPALPNTQAHTDAFTTEDQFQRNGGDEISQYAFVPASLSSKPTAAESDVNPGIQYAALSFPEKDKSEYENAAFDIM